MVFRNTFEIVSADSVQVYIGLDIGSGKLPADCRNRVPHHLIDIVAPDFHFDVASFCSHASRACDIIEKNNRIPMFVGGTGLYVDGFFKGLSPVPDVDPAVREKLNEEVLDRGLSALYDELLMVDPGAARAIHPNDRQRILRALQVFRGTGSTISSFRSKKVSRESGETLFIGIDRGRAELDLLIENRVDGMMNAGFLGEVESLLSKGFTSKYNSMKSIGYFELCEYFGGQISLSEAIAKIKKATRDYAKKQFSWFKREKRMIWFHPDELDKIADAVSIWLKNKK